MELEKIPTVSIEQLLELIDPKNPELLAKMGGSEGLATLLSSNIEKVF
jgi:hypothetical protein